MELATLLLKVDATDAKRSVKELNEELDKTQKEAKETEAATVQMGTVMKAVGATAAVALAAGLRKVVVESIDAQYAQAQLTAALKSTRGASRQTIESLNEQAAALQRLTTYSDEAVAGAQAILLTFTKIGGDTFPQATKAVADMATRMGGDLKGAAVQLGKALNDPVEGITALTRVGVSFSEAQKDVIKNLAETNRLAEAQALILKELEIEFGGSAAAARNTLGGALEGLKNAFGDLFEMDETQARALISVLNSMASGLERMKEAGVTFTAVLTKAADYVSQGTLGAIFKAMGLGAGAPTTSGLGPATVGTGTLPAMPTFGRRAGRGASRPTLGALPTPTGARIGIQGKAGGRFGTDGVNGMPNPMDPTEYADSAAGRMRQVAQEMAGLVRQMTAASAQITENFLRGLQGTFSGFFRQLFTEGVASFRGLMDSFKNLVLNTVAELAAKRLMSSIFSGGAGLLGGLSGGALLGIGAGAFALSRLFGSGNRSGYKKPAGVTAARAPIPNDIMPRGSEIRSSVGSALQEGTAVRLFGTFEAMRQSLVNIEGLLRNGALMGGTSSSGLDKALGSRSQSLRLAAGVAVVG